jgi:hypothetical protein
MATHLLRMARQVAEKVTSRFFTILLYEKESAVLVLSFVVLIGVRVTKRLQILYRNFVA